MAATGQFNRRIDMQNIGHQGDNALERHIWEDKVLTREASSMTERAFVKLLCQRFVFTQPQINNAIKALREAGYFA
jgi:hypothetical protein